MKVIITGMHRSGTSMVAGLLQKCGLYLGDNLLKNLSDNPKGHYEDRNFMRINAEILEANNGAWGIPPKKIIDVPGKLQNQMRAFVNMWPGDRIVGWKDPRACLTLQLWKKYIEPEELRVVLVLRPIQEIALSLKKRNKFSIPKGLSLAKFYLKKAYENLGELTYIETRYREYFRDWRSELGKITAFLGLKIPANSYGIEEFIDPGLWHHRC